MVSHSLVLNRGHSRRNWDGFSLLLLRYRLGIGGCSGVLRHSWRIRHCLKRCLWRRIGRSRRRRRIGLFSRQMMMVVVVGIRQFKGRGNVLPERLHVRGHLLLERQSNRRRRRRIWTPCNRLRRGIGRNRRSPHHYLVLQCFYCHQDSLSVSQTFKAHTIQVRGIH